MPSKMNTEFNYRYQVIGDTPWEKIKTLKGFLEGRVRAAVLEEVGNLKYQAKLAKLKRLEEEAGRQEAQCGALRQRAHLRLPRRRAVHLRHRRRGAVPSGRPAHGLEDGDEQRRGRTARAQSGRRSIPRAPETQTDGAERVVRAQRDRVGDGAAV